MRILSADNLKLKDRKEELESSITIIEKEKHELTTLFDGIDYHIISIDKDNDIVFINKSAKSLFLQISNKNIKLINLKLQKNGVPFSLIKYIKEHQKLYFTDISIQKEHGLYNLSINPLIDFNGEYRGAIIFIRSLTAEEELDKKKVEFASIASHEIRTPLTAIEGYLHLLLNSKKFKYDKDTKHYLEVLHDSSIDLMHLANDILTVTRIQQNTLNITLDKLNILNLIQQIAKEWEPRAQKKNLELKIISLEDIPDILTDSIRVKEILGNLLENAIKFTSKGSITLDIATEKDKVVVRVIDTGIGISSKEVTKLFKKFYQIENWQTREKGGTGLGLYISQTLAQKLGGEITINSKLGRGSVFSLILPKIYPHEKEIKKFADKELNTFIKDF